MAARPASLSPFGEVPQAVVRGQNFTVHRLAGPPGQSHWMSSSAEILLLFTDVGGQVTTAQDGRAVPARACVITPAGDVEITLSGAGRVFALTTGAAGLSPDFIINAADYEEADHRVTPIGTTATVVSPLGDRIRAYRVDDIPYPPGNARLKFLRTATMSMNWVEYDGPRDRRQLSPHAHDDFEQGALAIAGNFVHHIRTPWLANADQWRDDQHIAASADSMLIIPPHLIHTSEGVGEGRHILIDVFAPSRADFEAKGWIYNAGDYTV